MSIKKLAVEKAIAFLNSAGADFLIQFEEETFQSKDCPFALKQAEPEPGSRRKLHDFANATGYIKAINEMGVGAVLRWNRADFEILSTQVAWNNYKASVYSKAFARLGKDNFVCHVDKDESGEFVELMRVV